MSEKRRFVAVRRSWRDSRVAVYRLEDVQDVHWSVGQGLMARAPRHFLQGYVWCDGMVVGTLVHSGTLGPCPHRVPICIVKKDNERGVFEEFVSQAGPRPARPRKASSRKIER